MIVPSSAVLAALLLMFMLTGCTGDEPADDTGPSAPAATLTQHPSSAPPPELPGNVPRDLGSPIETFVFDDEHGHRATLDLFALQRFDAHTVQLWALIKRDPASRTDVRLGRLLTRGWNPMNELTAIPDGFLLLDVERKQLHLPMNQGLNPQCSPSLHKLSSTVQQAYVTCLFGRPQSDTVRIEIQNFGSAPHAQVP